MTPTLILGAHVSRQGDSIKVCEELAERLRAAGWPVLTASHRRNGLARGLDVTATALARRRDYAVAQIDVYSGRAFRWAEAAATAVRAAGRPFVLTLHGGALPAMAERDPDRIHRLLRRARAVTAPSSYLWRRFQAWSPRIEIMPNAIDLGRYPYRRRDQPEPKLIWLRAFHEIYNSILAVEALVELQRAVPNATLRMVGPDRRDGALARCNEARRKLGVESAVTVAGWTPKAQVPAALAACDIFLSTSRVDNAPVSVVEAMACGLCVVSVDVGGMRDLIDDGVDGLLVPADPRALAGAVKRLLTEPGLAARLSANARRKAESFDWGAILPRWQTLLKEAAESG